MLSQSKFNEILEELNSIRDYSSIISKSSKNATTIPALRKSDFIEKYELKQVSYIKLEVAEKANSHIYQTIDEISFFYYVSQFERICYEIAISGIKQTKEFYSTGTKIKNIEAFIRDSDQFFPFRTIAFLFNNEEIEFIKELIAVRNYLAHGKKDIKLLKTDDESPNARMGLVNKLDEVHKKCINLLTRLVKD